MKRVETGYMHVQTERHPHLDSLMASMTEADGHHPYSVAWIDALASGRSLGRSVLEVGRHACLDDLTARLRTPGRLLAFSSRPSTG